MPPDSSSAVHSALRDEKRRSAPPAAPAADLQREAAEVRNRKDPEAATATEPRISVPMCARSPGSSRGMRVAREGS